MGFPYNIIECLNQKSKFILSQRIMPCTIPLEGEQLSHPLLFPRILHLLETPFQEIQHIKWFLYKIIFQPQLWKKLITFFIRFIIWIRFKKLYFIVFSIFSELSLLHHVLPVFFFFSQLIFIVLFWFRLNYFLVLLLRFLHIEGDTNRNSI